MSTEDQLNKFREAHLSAKGMKYYKKYSLKSFADEKWRSIIAVDKSGELFDYSGFYMVSSLGRIKSIKRIIMVRGGDGFAPKPKPIKEMILRQRVSNTNRLIVPLHIGNRLQQWQVARLVAFTFHKNPEGKKEVNHINGIKWDNRAINLEWATREENIQHALKKSLYKRGESAPTSKLTERQVVEIFHSQLSQRSIALKYNISQRSVFSIKKGISWKWLIK